MFWSGWCFLSKLLNPRLVIILSSRHAYRRTTNLHLSRDISGSDSRIDEDIGLGRGRFKSGFILNWGFNSELNSIFNFVPREWDSDWHSRVKMPIVDGHNLARCWRSHWSEYRLEWSTGYEHKFDGLNCCAIRSYRGWRNYNHWGRRRRRIISLRAKSNVGVQSFWHHQFWASRIRRFLKFA